MICMPIVIEVKIKLREHLKLLNASQKHKDHLSKLNSYLEHISKNAKAVCVINTDNGDKMKYRSLTLAAKFFNVHPEIARRYIKGNKLL